MRREAQAGAVACGGVTGVRSRWSVRRRPFYTTRFELVLDLENHYIQLYNQSLRYGGRGGARVGHAAIL